MENNEKESTVKPQVDEEDEEDDGPPPGWQPIPHPHQPPPQQPPLQPQPQPPPPSEIAQMVCGSCRRLLTYPRGSKHVLCSCCQTVNYVLQAHQVGQVKCGSCKVLLMYPYGASSVKCSSCHFVTEIGDHNRRLPWSVQQGQHTTPFHTVR